MKINNSKNITLLAVILAAANLTFAGEASQTHGVDHTEMKFEWSSISNPSFFQCELEEDVSSTLSLCITQIMNHEITKNDLPKMICDLLKVDDPGNNPSENLARASVSASLTKGLSQYMDDPQSVKITPANEIVSTVLDKLRGKTPAVSKNAITDEQKRKYADVYHKSLANINISKRGGTERKIHPTENASVSNTLVDMNQIAAEQTQEMLNKIKTAGKDGQNQLKEIMTNTSGDVDTLVAESKKNAKDESEKLQGKINKIKNDLKNQKSDDKSEDTPKGDEPKAKKNDPKKPVVSKSVSAPDKVEQSQKELELILSFLKQPEILDQISVMKKKGKSRDEMAYELARKYPELADVNNLVRTPAKGWGANANPLLIPDKDVVQKVRRALVVLVPEVPEFAEKSASTSK